MSDSQIRRYTPTGGPVPGNVRAFQEPGPRLHTRGTYALRRGFVQKVVYPDDSENVTGRLEYVVTIGGQDYKGVLDMTARGGMYGNSIRVRSGVTTLGPITLDKTTPEDEKDGDAVWCLFINGDGDRPIIVGSDLHPRREENADWVEPSASEGAFERDEFNGWEWKIDKEGKLTLRCVGLKSNSPIPSIPAQGLETTLTLDQDGNLDFLNATGTHVRVDNTEDSVTMEAAFGDKVTISAADGVQVFTPAVGGTSASFKAGEVAIEAALNVSVKASAGELTLEGSGGKAKLANGMVGFGGATAELLDLVDKLMDEAKKTATEVQTCATASAAIIVPTAVGPSGVPTNAATFTTSAANCAAIIAAITALKAQLGTIKGGI